MSNDGIRLQRMLAQAGLGSRRQCDALIGAGRVLVNGEPANLGLRIDPVRDVVVVDGKTIVFTTARVVLMFNKPAGVVTTMSDERGRPCVGDFVRDFPERLFHVGRLDEDTEGLLLLTNDGDLAHQLMHPSHGVQKTYLAQVQGRVTEETARLLLAGVTLTDGRAAADKVRVDVAYPDWSVLEIVLHEGRKRIVRRMCKAVGHPVQRLMRTRLAQLDLGDLPVGEMRRLTAVEIDAISPSIPEK